MPDASLDQNLFELGAAPAATPGQAEYVEGRAIIAYQSMLDAADVSIAASSAASGFAAVNVKSRLTYSGWKPSAGGAQTLTFTGTAGHTVDYLGIAGHNLFSQQATLDLQSSDDGVTWASLLGGGVAPVSDAPLLLIFTESAKNHFRLVVNVAGAAYPTLAVVMLGQRMPLQRGIYVGHRPAPLNRELTYHTNDSEGGQMIGRSVVRRANRTALSFSRLTPSWLRSTWMPFQRAAETLPFFFMWNTQPRYRGEVIYGQMMNQPEPVNSHQSFMSVELEIRGLA